MSLNIDPISVKDSESPETISSGPIEVVEPALKSVRVEKSALVTVSQPSNPITLNIDPKTPPPHHSPGTPTVFSAGRASRVPDSVRIRALREKEEREERSRSGKRDLRSGNLGERFETERQKESVQKMTDDAAEILKAESEKLERTERELRVENERIVGERSYRKRL